MRLHARTSLLALLTGALIAVSLPAAAQGAPGIANFFAANCKVDTCKRTIGETPKEELEKAQAEGFTQAGGHPNWGVTDFTVKTVPVGGGIVAPEGVLTHVRTDVAPGVSTNPETVPKCSLNEFGEEFEPAPGIHTGLYFEPECEVESNGVNSEVGVNEVVVFAENKEGEKFDIPLTGTVYNLEPPAGLASDYGVALPLPKAITEELLSGYPGQLYAHTFIKGSVEWGAEPEGTGKADYHDYFEIEVSPLLPLISSRLSFKGNTGERGFITNPTTCTGTGPQTTTTLKLKYEKGETAEAKYSPPIGTENCGLVPFNPGFAVAQTTKGSDLPDGLTTEFSLPHNTVAEEESKKIYDSSQVKTATVALPEGITINPSAAAGLEACTPEEIGIGTKNP